MAHVKDLHAELLSVPAAAPGTGTVTSVHVTTPLTGGGPGPVVNIGITAFDATHAGYVPSPGVADDSKVLESDGWHDKGTGQFVDLQVATPGITQVGNFHVSGVGIIEDGSLSLPAAQLSVSSSGKTGIRVFTNGQNAGYFETDLANTAIQGYTASGTAGFFSSTSGTAIQAGGAGDGGSFTVDSHAATIVNYTGAGDALNIIASGDNSTALDVQSSGATATGTKIAALGSGSTGINVEADQTALICVSDNANAAFFQSQSSTPGTPAVVVGKFTGASDRLLEMRDASNNPVFTFDVTGALTGIGPLPASPDAMLHLFAPNAFAGNAAMIIENDGQGDNQILSKIALSDTNAATTLGNAVIGLQTVAGAKPDLVFWTGGADNDTQANDGLHITGADNPPIVYVNFPGLGASQGSFVFQVGGGAYFDGQIKANSGILMAGDLDLATANIVNGGAVTLTGGALNIVNNGATIGGGDLTVSAGNIDVSGNSVVNANSLVGASGTPLGIATALQTVSRPVILVDAAGTLVTLPLDNSGSNRRTGNMAMAGQLAVGSTTIGASVIKATGLQAFANNTAATTGGLGAGDFYEVTGSDPRQVAVVF